MRVHTAFWSSLSLWLVVTTGACDSNKQLGSACPGGVCPTQSAVQGPACLAGSYFGEIAVGEGSDELCLPRALPFDDGGNAQCEVVWTLPTPEAARSGEPTRCSEREFLTFSYATAAGERCVVRRLTAAQRAAGGEGWYYDSDESHPCGVTGAIRFTDGAQPSAGMSARFHCEVLEARDENGDVGPIAADECASPPEEVDPSSVGATCLPDIIPPDGFDPREAYVEIGSPECETGTCLVFQLDGDPSAECQPKTDGPPCASAAEVERSVYCSCRCDVPGGAPGDGCKCPNGFACQDLFDRGPDTIRGGHCVRSDSISGL